MQIALVAIVLLAGAWFTVLKPKDSDDAAGTDPVPAQAAPKAPGQKGLENAVAQAKGAVGASNGSAAATKAAATAASGDAAPAKAATPATPAKPAPAKAAAPTKPATSATGSASNGTAAATGKSAPAATAKTNGTPALTAKPSDAKADAKPSDPSAPLLARLAQGKTVVMLFTQSKHNSVEAAARRALLALQKADKDLVIRIVPIRDVGRYDAITTGVAVLTSPTILVIGKDRKALSTSGYTELRTLKQMVGDVQRSAAATAKTK